MRPPPLPYVWSAVLGSFGLLFALRFVFEVRAVAVVVLFAALFALVLVFPINLLSRGLPRSVAALLTLAGVLALLVGAFFVSTPFFGTQLGWLMQRAPSALTRAQGFLRHSTLATSLPNSWRQSVGDELAHLLGQVVPVAFDVAAALSSCLAVLALASFFAYEGERTEQALLRLIPKDKETEVARFLRRAARLLQRWMVGQLASMTATGVLVAVGLLLLGVQSWLVLGALSFVLEFIPYLGPLLSAVPGIASGLAESPQLALWVALVYGAVQLVESYVLQPMIMQRAIRIQPAFQLIWQLVMASGFGLLGIFVATPLLACMQVVLQHFYIEGMLGKAPAGEAPQPHA